MLIEKPVKLLNREGSKFRYRKEIIEQFPPHKTYIEPFLGTGSIFFNKELAQYNILNDSSKFIYNFFKELENPKILYEKVEKALIYPDIIEENIDKIEYQVIRLLYSLYGSGTITIETKSSNSKQLFLDRLVEFSSHYKLYIKHSIIHNQDSISFLNLIKWNSLISSFVYCDPPYSISKGRINDNKGWSLDKLENLIEVLLSKNVRFAISEFNDIKIVDLFKKYNLNIVEIARSTGVNTTFKKEKIEILGTNYTL